MKLFISTSANVVNPEDVKQWVAKFHCQPNIDRWLDNTLVKYVINDTKILVAEKLKYLPHNAPQWQKDAASKDELYRFNPSTLRVAPRRYAMTSLAQNIEHAIGWLKTFPQEKQLNVAVEEAIRQGNLLIKLNNAKASSAEGSIEILHTFADGYTMANLVDAQALKREGKLMGHCVGDEQQNYIERVANHTLQIWSLRDEKNQPHCTIEYLPREKSILQIKGKQNTGVILKYQPYIQEWLKQCKKQRLIKGDVKDLTNAGIIVIDKVWYTADSLLQNPVLLKHVSTQNLLKLGLVKVEGKGYRRLSDLEPNSTLVFEGDNQNLEIADNSIVFPKNTTLKLIECDVLDMENYKVKEFPDGFTLKIDDEMSIQLPNSLTSINVDFNTPSTVGVDLYYAGNTLTIPEGFGLGKTIRLFTGTTYDYHDPSVQFKLPSKCKLDLDLDLCDVEGSNVTNYGEVSAALRELDRFSGVFSFIQELTLTVSPYNIDLGLKSLLKCVPSCDKLTLRTSRWGTTDIKHSLNPFNDRILKTLATVSNRESIRSIDIYNVGSSTKTFTQKEIKELGFKGVKELAIVVQK